MHRKKILWLASWYPSRGKPFDGDFIQRHAKAAALYNDVHVIHVAALPAAELREKKAEEINNEEGLTEQLIYFAKSTSWPGRIKAQYNWFRLFKNAVRTYLAQHGTPDLVHVHVTMKAGLVALWIRRRYKIPFVVTEHWAIYNDVIADNYERKSSLFKNYTKRIIKEAAIFLPVCNFLGAGVQSLVVDKPFEVILNATDTQLFYYKKKTPGKFRFIHVSTMVPRKNVKGILRAIDLLYRDKQFVQDFEMIMIGDTEPAIRNFADDLGLLNKIVFFRGEIPYAQVATEMQDADVMVLFSDIENSPCVIGEALCCGLPVIVTGVGGIPELVNESNSIMVQPRDDEGLAKAMQRLSRTYSQYNKQKIAVDASNKFSYETIGKMIDEAYETLNELKAES